MLIDRKTSALAIRHAFDPRVLGGVAEAVVKDGAKVLGRVGEEVAGKVAGDWAKALAEKVRGHLTDHSEKLNHALARSRDRAWKTIEIALGGDRFWDKFASAEDHALRDQVRAFLASAVMEDDPGYLTACLKELRQARKHGHLAASDGVSPSSLADEVGPFARYDDPDALLDAECAFVKEIAGELHRLGYRHLGRLLAVTPTRGQPLLATAAQYYFRRAVAEDAVLSRELAWVKLDSIDAKVREGFAFLALILERHGPALEEVLEGQARVEVIVGEVHSVVLDMHERVRELTSELKLIRQELKPGHSVSYRDDSERELIREVKRRYRALGDDHRRRFPQLGLDLGRLEIVAGDFEEAMALAGEAARDLDDPAAKADAYHTRYRSALELKAWGDALDELKRAAAIDARYLLWPSTKYRVEKILGAGAFAVAFLGQHLILPDDKAVIKAFDLAGLDRDIATIFREALILRNLKHPGIIHLIDCGFADAAQRRPYLELEHFADSLTLQDHVERHGPIGVDDLMPIAVQIAEALKAAHLAGVWHRDVKPGNLLVRKSSRGWEVKVIDFGLSIRRGLVQASQARASGLGQSMIGSAVAGTMNYAPPEQLDPARSREVGPHSDVYGFGRTCLFGLFKTTKARAKAIRDLPEPWPDLLDDCCDEEIVNRPKDFVAVLERLHVAVPPPPPPPPPPVVVKPVVSTPKPPGPAPQFTNSLGMTMVRIEPTEKPFLMGTSKAQVDQLVKLYPNANRSYYDAEQPQHPVTITRPFFLAAHQVTVGQFRRFVEASRYKTTAESTGEGAYGLVGKEWKQDPKINWRNPGFAQGDDHPVVCVSHDDAVAFLNWLNDQEKSNKRSYGLPTEAEWEYACRAGTGGLWGASDDPESLARIANVADASLRRVIPDAESIRGDDGFVYTAPVGSFEPNAWRLFDMIGNVWEWCDDWYDSNFYKKSPKGNPRNTSKAAFWVIRGGSWGFAPRFCRPAYRRGGASEFRCSDLGFRVAAVQA